MCSLDKYKNSVIIINVITINLHSSDDIRFSKKQYTGAYIGNNKIITTNIIYGDIYYVIIDNITYECKLNKLEYISCLIIDYNLDYNKFKCHVKQTRTYLSFSENNVNTGNPCFILRHDNIQPIIYNDKINKILIFEGDIRKCCVGDIIIDDNGKIISFINNIIKKNTILALALALALTLDNISSIN